MKTKRFLVLALASTTVLGGTIPAIAETSNVTGSSPTSFNVTGNMFESGDLVITVPDSLTLEYSAENGNFTKEAQVNAKGNINPKSKVVITTPTNITYTHADDPTVTANCTVTFGTEDGDNQVTTWSAVELRDGGIEGVSKALSLVVEKNEVEYIDDYKSTLHYNISVEAKKNVAGVYDANGDLLANWSTLKAKGLDISKTSGVSIGGSSTLYGVLLKLGYSKTAREVIIPDTETVIEKNALGNCFSLTSITLPNSITSIGNRAFVACSSLTSINIPDSVTSIGEYAFAACSSLTSINIPDSVTSIDEHAFSSCKSLTSVTLPDSLTDLSEATFATTKDGEIIGCSLTSVTYKGTTYTNSTDVENALVDNNVTYKGKEFNTNTSYIWGYNDSTGKVTWGN